MMLFRPAEFLLAGFLIISLILPNQAKAGEPVRFCGGIAGISCPDGSFCQYPNPMALSKRGICRERTSKALIEYGDTHGMSGDAQGATAYYDRANNLAAQNADPYAMVMLSDRYLRWHHERAAMESYRRAVAYASQWINEDSGRGQRHAVGVTALQNVINNYTSTLQLLPASPATGDWFKSQTLAANDLLAARTSRPSAKQSMPQKEPQLAIAPPVPDPSAVPPGIFCPPETMSLGGHCLSNMAVPSLPPAK